MEKLPSLMAFVVQGGFRDAWALERGQAVCQRDPGLWGFYTSCVGAEAAAWGPKEKDTSRDDATNPGGHQGSGRHGGEGCKGRKGESKALAASESGVLGPSPESLAINRVPVEPRLSSGGEGSIRELPWQPTTPSTR